MASNYSGCWSVPQEGTGERIDKWLILHLPQVTRSEAQKAIEQGSILVNGRQVGKNYKLRLGDQVEAFLLEKREEVGEILPESIPLNIVYEDEHLLVVNKPKHMVVHPAPGNPSGNLVNALAYHCKTQLSTLNGEFRQGIVHRIDKDTSGLLVVAKTDQAYTCLAQQIKAHTTHRFYEAVVYGRFKEPQGTINAPIGRHPADRKKKAVVKNGGREAVSHYQVLTQYEGFAHLRLKLQTGRTHQIRVHMASIGHPVAGDEIYGPKKAIKKLEGQCLHAKALGFIHPVTGEHLYFESPLPEYFCAFLKTLGKGASLLNNAEENVIL